MKDYDLEERTLDYSVQVITTLRKFKFDGATKHILSQLVRSVTSIGANYREARQAGSRKDFSYRVRISRKEASESQYWLNILKRVFPEKNDLLTPLFIEASELLAIFITISKKAD